MPALSSSAGVAGAGDHKCRSCGTAGAWGIKSLLRKLERFCESPRAPWTLHEACATVFWLLNWQVKPVRASDSSRALTDAQLARLRTTFADGVCDYSRPGVEQDVVKARWLAPPPGARASLWIDITTTGVNDNNGHVDASGLGDAPALCFSYPQRQDKETGVNTKETGMSIRIRVFPGSGRMRALATLALVAAFATTPTCFAKGGYDDDVRGDRDHQGSDFQIETLSTKPELVSGGDVLVRIELPHGVSVNKVRVELNNRNVSGAFSADAKGRTLTGLVTGLKRGKNVLEVSASGKHGGPSRRLLLTNHPISGPLSPARIRPRSSARRRPGDSAPHWMRTAVRTRRSPTVTGARTTRSNRSTRPHRRRATCSGPRRAEKETRWTTSSRLETGADRSSCLPDCLPARTWHTAAHAVAPHDGLEQETRLHVRGWLLGGLSPGHVERRRAHNVFLARGYAVASSARTSGATTATTWSRPKRR